LVDGAADMLRDRHFIRLRQRTQRVQLELRQVHVRPLHRVLNIHTIAVAVKEHEAPVGMVMNLSRGMAAVVVVAVLQGATLAQEQLTDVERLQWELTNTREQLHAAMVERDACRVQVTPIRAEVLKSERAKLKAAIEAAHPGWELNLDTNRLTKKPETPKER
jgi:hypothetical protein